MSADSTRQVTRKNNKNLLNLGKGVLRGVAQGAGQGRVDRIRHRLPIQPGLELIRVEEDRLAGVDLIASPHACLRERPTGAVDAQPERALPGGW